MTVSNTDLFLVNRGGTDYSVEFSKIFADIDANITIGDGKITIKNSDGSEVGSFTTNQAGDATITLPQVVIPDSLHPKGFIDVSAPAPSDPDHGDIYIQNSINGTVTADSSFAPGITGDVDDGVFIVFGVDDLWHAGGQANQTVVQSDWAEVDVTDPAYIHNKPNIEAIVDNQAGNGQINVNAGAGLIATGQNATANQAGDTTRTLAVQVGSGITVDGSNNLIIDPNFSLDSNVTAPNDGKLTIKDSDGLTVGEFTANQSTPTDVTLPKGFSGDYGDLTNTPDVYTKQEADAKFMPLDISTLPPLS